MRRFLTVPTAILTVVFLIAGCTSSDDTAEEPTTAAPATTVAPPETATTTAATVAPPETVTTTPIATSTTVSPAAAIAAVNAFNDALNAYDANAIRAVCAEGAIDRYNGIMIGSPEWEQLMTTHREWRGVENTMADCEVTDHMVTCQVTVDEKNLTGKAGIVLTLETYIQVNDQGLITAIDWTFLSGVEEYDAFEAALGDWMATAHPEAYETFYPGFGSNEEAWLSGIDELSPLIDEFVAQSNEYPLGS